MMNSIERILKEYWNFDSFRSLQKNIINDVLKGRDILTLLPTGSGKSICFQIPALAKSGVCIVISPLIALMEDQVKSLELKGIKAIALTSKYNMEDSIKAFDNLQFGNYKFLYLSPEKLQSEFIQTKIKHLNVNLIAIDEAHCISEWGHDFRPAYLKISILREIHPKVNLIALTASATPKVSSDIVKNLRLKNAAIYRQSFSRKNLVYKTFKTENTRNKLKHLLLKINACSIVYTNSRRQCIELSNYLNQHNFKSSYYHGGLTNKEKMNSFSNWMEDKTPIMVATNAFGMGIDKSNVRAVIHMHIPYSIENYLQEVGRAGRDNIESYAFLIFNDGIIDSCRNYLVKSTADFEYHRKVYAQLNQYYQISIGEFSEKSVSFNINDFCLKYDISFLKIKQVLSLFKNEGVLDIQQYAFSKSTLKIIVSNSYLFNYESKNKDLNTLLKVILRNYGGVFEQFIKINESFIAKKLNIHKSKVIERLNRLELDKIIIYKKVSDDVQLKFLMPREDQFIINNLSKHIRHKNKLKSKKLNSMIEYIVNDTTCRNVQLQRYFEEKKLVQCNTCDVCSRLNNENNNVSVEVIAKEILMQLDKNPILSFEEILDALNYQKELIIKTLQLMIEHDTIQLTSLNKIEKVTK